MNILLKVKDIVCIQKITVVVLHTSRGDKYSESFVISNEHWLTGKRWAIAAMTNRACCCVMILSVWRMHCTSTSTGTLSGIQNNTSVLCCYKNAYQIVRDKLAIVCSTPHAVPCCVVSGSHLADSTSKADSTSCWQYSEEPSSVSSNLQTRNNNN